LSAFDGFRWRGQFREQLFDALDALGDFVQMIHRNKKYKLAGQDKLRVEADLHEVAERVERVKQLFAELAAPPEPVKSRQR